jgi:hypothetical protein
MKLILLLIRQENYFSLPTAILVLAEKIFSFRDMQTLHGFLLSGLILPLTQNLMILE